MIAYEPVWAIGTGRTATPGMAAEAHAFLRGLARDQFGESAADGVRILYGGSVKPDNIGGLMAQEEIDGALVGGASLKVDSFSALINYPPAEAPGERLHSMVAVIQLVHILVSILLIGAVLLQGGENVDITAAFGGPARRPSGLVAP